MPLSGKDEFSTKITEISYLLLPHVKNKEVRISQITEEKTSAIKGWLFKNALPPNKKRLKVADRLGVSEDFLYGKDKAPGPPVTLYDGELDVYAIPMMSESDIFNIYKKKVPIPVVKRYTQSLRSKLIDHISDYELTYCFEVKTAEFLPFILQGDLVFFNQSFGENNEFSLLVSPNLVQMVRHPRNKSELLNDDGGIVLPGPESVLIPVILVTHDGFSKDS